ncbi:PDZ and LIM domain protein Zasp like protein [Argiope bruennichi]|uniref:PDZ and LIM domain protein Zasp like protein n=1 Tax=Argiope bruennichi TaxID=94029 RepID=A0A8T0E431_ARGBR|nr:PDZ and LIM domain protein Zasp like protein [Argiope bruennichi]
MKPEKPINTMSEVYKLVQEEEQNKVRSPTPGGCTSPPIFRPSKIPPSVPPKPQVSAPPAPAATPAPAPAPVPAAPAPSLPTLKPTAPVHEGPSQGPCSDCGRPITGAFVGLTDRILHQECFNCSTCGASLKNIGFHNINNKLYCDPHAKLAARIIAGQAATPAAPAFTPAPAAPQPAPAPYTPPKPAAAPAVPPMPAPLPTSSLAPQPAVVPKLPTCSIPQPTPLPFGANLPQTPSSSGGLSFRSISPQPWKRLSGEYHSVKSPTSPTPGSTPSAPPAYSSGPLPFEMKPYMPPEQYTTFIIYSKACPYYSKSSIFSSVSESSSSEISQTSQTTQVIQRTTQVTQQVSSTSQSQYSLDYKQVIGGQQKTKFVWPPPKPQFEIEGGAPAESSSGPGQNYSPLVTQSTPAAQLPKSESAPSFRSVQPPVPQQQPAAPPTSMFTVPPLPTTFSAQPAKVEETPAPAPAPAPTMSFGGSLASNFSPVLPPIVDLKPTTAPAQPGVPTGAGSKPAPKKGRGQLMKEQVPGRIPVCGDCGEPIRGPFIIALNRTWCPDHFHCNNLHCKTNLIDIGFVEEQGQLYCENCYEQFLAPICNKCNVRIKGDCLNALDKQWHPECFICAYCKKPFGNNSFYLEDGLPYCEKDWNELFTTKCVGCGFPIEAGDRWVEALNNNYHSQCFKCSVCQKNLEGQSFYAKGGKPFCKQHAR